eukprot:CAMPEP_0177620452 /NCGR_PEP_ID=MMETSP0419_2-20121207/26912_1 /TAXON_ID=582737 /ORGANISM="Tetraselmis sp., Strain GSL018" /LENGTH=656 /DNA_ID=CAMNT_0019120009 /DNA_START=247 /DNA_END=2214 /DNA_ORIENTATION=-
MPANLRPNSFTFGFREAASQRRKLSESSGKNTKFTAKNPLWEETLEQKSPERESLSACEFLEENDEHSVLDHSTKFFVREVEVSPSEFEGCWQDYTKISGEKAAQPLLEPDSPDFQQRSAQAGLHQNSIVKLSLPATANQDGNMCRSCMGLPIISPMDRQYSVWRWLVLSLDATYAAFVIPMTILLEPTYHGALDWLDVMSIVSMTVYVADILVGFNVAWVAVSQDLKKVLVVDPNKIVKFYLRKSFTVDLLTASPYVLEVLLEIIGLAMPLPLWCLVAAPWIRGLRIMRLIRARHLFRLDFLAKVTSRVSPAVSTLVMLMYFVAFLVNILGCLWYFIGVQNGMEDSWMTSKFLISWVEVEPGSWETAEVPLMDSGFVPKYISALYWTTTTLTTVGFGDIVPQNILEMLISIFVEFLGVVIFGLLINSLANVFMINSKEARRAQAVQDRISEADEWMLMKRVRKDIRTKVRNYFTDIWARQLSVKDERNLLEDLPYHLRAEVAMSILSESLQEAPQTLLSTLPEAIQRLIVVGMVPHTILGNHSLSHEGQPCESMWLLHSGEFLVPWDVPPIPRDPWWSTLAVDGLNTGTLSQTHVKVVFVCADSLRQSWMHSSIWCIQAHLAIGFVLSLEASLLVHGSVSKIPEVSGWKEKFCLW